MCSRKMETYSLFWTGVVTTRMVETGAGKTEINVGVKRCTTTWR